MKTTTVLYTAALLIAMACNPYRGLAQDGYKLSDKIGLTDQYLFRTDAEKKTAPHQNNARIVFSNTTARSNRTKAYLLAHNYFNGADDADSTYTAKQSGKRVVFFSAIIGSPVLGVIPALICIAKPPVIDRFALRNRGLASNTAFMKGYIYEARQINKKAIWGNYIAGSTIWIGAIQFLIF